MLVLSLLSPFPSLLNPSSGDRAAAYPKSESLLYQTSMEIPQLLNPDPPNGVSPRGV